MAAGVEIDTLEPPLDPLRPYRKRLNVTEIWQPSDTSRALEAVPSKGFDIDTVPQFDASDDPYAISSSTNGRVDDSANSSSNSLNESSPKPGWKFW